MAKKKRKALRVTYYLRDCSRPACARGEYRDGLFIVDSGPSAWEMGLVKLALEIKHEDLRFMLGEKGSPAVELCRGCFMLISNAIISQTSY